MIVNGRLTAYLHSLDTGNGALCGAIEKEAIKARVPILKRETAALLKTMVLLKRPERILEVGTAVGYSALIMAQVMPETAHITTIEKYEKRIPEAKKNFSRAGMEEEPGTGKTVVLDGDETVAEVGEILEEAGLIRDSRAFTIQAMVYEYEVQPGTYELNTSESSKEIIAILREAPAAETEAGQ